MTVVIDYSNVTCRCCTSYNSVSIWFVVFILKIKNVMASSSKKGVGREEFSIGKLGAKGAHKADVSTAGGSRCFPLLYWKKSCILTRKCFKNLASTRKM